MPKSSKILLLVVSVVLVMTVFVGTHASGVSAATEQADGAYRQIDVYSEVLRHIQADYVTVPDIPVVTNGALRGLLESLDADSSYLSPADYTLYKNALKSDRTADGMARRNALDRPQGPNRAQVGMVVSKRFGYATVVSVVPNSPADKAGVYGWRHPGGDQRGGYAGPLAGDDPVDAGGPSGYGGDGVRGSSSQGGSGQGGDDAGGDDGASGGGDDV